MADDVQEVSPADRLLAALDRNRRWIFLALGLLLVAGYNGQWRISPDSALYVELGRNLAEGAGFTYHGEPHTWVEPGLPYSVAASFRLFGPDNFHPLMVVMLACTGATLALTYALLRLHGGRPLAVLMVTLLGLSETFYRYGFHLFTDMPFLMGVMAFLLAYEWIVRGERAWLAWPLVAVTVLFMTAVRPAVITLVGAVGITAAWHVLRGPMRVRHAVLGAVVLATFLGFRLLDPRRGEAGGGQVQREAMLKSLVSDRLGAAVERMVTKWIPKVLEETTTEALFGTRLGPGVSHVVAIVAIVAGIALVRRRTLWGVWVAATVAQLTFWRPLERYFLPVLPLMLLGLWNVGTWIARRSGAPRLTPSPPYSGERAGVRGEAPSDADSGPGPHPNPLPRVRGRGDKAAAWLRWAPVAIFVMLVVPNVVYIAKFIGDQRRRPFLAEYNDGEKLELIDLAARLRDAIPPDGLVIADSARELSYFSRRKVVDPLTSRRVPPTDAEYAALREKLANVPEVFVVEPGENTGAMVKRLDGAVEEQPVTSLGEWTVRRVRFTPPASP